MTSDPVAMAAPRWPAAPATRDDRTVAFAEFYGEYYARVARYCFRIVREEELARDLAQEAFARLYIRWLAVRDPAPYLFHVATNLARDAFTRAAREARAMDSVGPPAAREDHRDMHDAVERLPRRYREVVLLYYFADLPIASVAAAVRRPDGTVKRLLSEARDLLADALEGTS